jgi:hypothetical protein
MQARPPTLAARHPIVLFWVVLAPASAVLQFTWARFAGGLTTWGGDIVWFRVSSLANDLVLAAGAYVVTRAAAGPRWFARPHIGPWATFTAVCAAGAVFLMVLARRLVALYPEPRPPLGTGWLAVWQRTWLPFFLLLWVRRRTSAPRRPR